jgi:hypothetical protein
MKLRSYEDMLFTVTQSDLRWTVETLALLRMYYESKGREKDALNIGATISILQKDIKPE